jgi:hypothetical protein
MNEADKKMDMLFHIQSIWVALTSASTRHVGELRILSTFSLWRTTWKECGTQNDPKMFYLIYFCSF